MNKISTSFNVEETIYKKFKIKCIEKNIEYGKAIEELMSEWLKK